MTYPKPNKRFYRFESCPDYTKQITMKLYTEEQVRWAFRNGHIYAHLNEVDENEFIGELVPIELPSDEEIINEVHTVRFSSKEYKSGVIEGMQWMRDKIQK